LAASGHASDSLHRHHSAEKTVILKPAEQIRFRAEDKTVQLMSIALT
jgi:hypothetical protein